MKAAQVAHAAGSYRHLPHTHVVILTVPDEPALRRLAQRLDDLDLEHALIVESDPPHTDQAMSIGCALVADRTPMRKVVSNLPLLR